jgi:hypothetical protein
LTGASLFSLGLEKSNEVTLRDRRGGNEPLDLIQDQVLLLVFEVGPEIDWLEAGQWVYVEYGRWTEALVVEDERFDTPDSKKKMWKVDPKGCIAVSDEEPDNTISFNTEAVGAMKKTLY